MRGTNTLLDRLIDGAIVVGLLVFIVLKLIQLIQPYIGLLLLTAIVIIAATWLVRAWRSNWW
jgi:uncharacterized membrane protein YjgN (DUF898 family)